MTTTFENQIKIMARLNRVVGKTPKLDSIAHQISLGLNLAMAIDYGIITERSEKITSLISEAFRYVVRTYGLEDTGFEHAWEIDPNLRMPDIWIAQDNEDDEDEETEEDD
jgi:hypothetical protein